MTRAYSNDLRERVAASIVSGRSCRETAALFGVSVASAVKWSQRLRATGSAACKPMGHRPGRALVAQKAFILERLKAEATLRGLVKELAERGVATSYISVWRVVHEEGLSFKKSLFASEQARPDVARRRARWKAHQAKLVKPIYDGIVKESEGSTFAVFAGFCTEEDLPCVQTAVADFFRLPVLFCETNARCE